MADSTTRQETDALGTLELPQGALYGIHTQRSLSNFPLSRQPIHPYLIAAMGQVKLACYKTNQSLGYFDENPQKARAIEEACLELTEGRLDAHILVDKLQGGAGTSTNMNVNEVVANRALQLMGRSPGDYETISPLGDINLHQSTNDVYPTALRLATIQLIKELEESVVALQEAFQKKEQAFAHVVKVGRTEYQDAALITLGREMSTYAEALSRDRWRLYKCQERLRVINLGGTAIGTGISAPREYIFQVVDKLRELTGIGFARAENLVEATANADTFVEVSGMTRALAVTLQKAAMDLRFLSSGPMAGIGEVSLPPRQAGSSIMPGKVNPVIPEAVCQISLLVMAHDQALSQACAMGHLQLNPFLPLVAYCLLDNLTLLRRVCDSFRDLCVAGLEADLQRCEATLRASTALLTALLPFMSYSEISSLAVRATEERCDLRTLILETGRVSAEQLDDLLSPEAICRLGFRAKPRTA